MNTSQLSSMEQRHVVEEVHNYLEQGVGEPVTLRSSRLSLPLSAVEENDVRITLGRLTLEQRKALFQAIQEKFDKTFLPDLFKTNKKEPLTPDLSKPTLSERTLSTHIWDLHFGELNEDIHSLLEAQRRVHGKSTDFPMYYKVVEILRIDQDGRLQISDIFEIAASPGGYKKAVVRAVKNTLEQLGLPIGSTLNNVEIARFNRIKAKALKPKPRFGISERDPFPPINFQGELL